MATKKRVYAATQDQEAAASGSGDEGATVGDTALAIEVYSLRKALKQAQKDLKELAVKQEAFDFSIHDIEDGKKISVVKKNLGMTKYLYAWVKNAEEVNKELKMPEKGANGTK